jgi:Glycosyltransferase 61
MPDLADARQIPSPAGGWSTQVRAVPRALVCPIAAGYLVHEAGIFDAGGQYVHEGVLWRGRPLLVAPPMPIPVAQLPGRWVWGGVLHGHFGHFLTESTGRLWALDTIKADVAGLVFVAKRDVGAEMKPFHKTFLELLGVHLPVKIITEPTTIEMLEVPGQGFGIGPLASGTDLFRTFIHRHFAVDVVPQGGDKLYISRSELSVTLGGIVEEVRLERYLAACGYEIFHPQNFTLQDQIARYKAARKIVALDGSALHLLAMVGTADQTVVMIKRRNSNGSNGIVRHLTAFMEREPLVLDVIAQNWVRSDRPGVDNFSFGELDLATLGTELGRAGFVPKGVDWTSLTPAETNAAIRLIETKLRRRKLTFHPLLRGAPAPDAATRRDRLVERAERRLRQAAKALRKSGGAPDAP